MGAPLKNYPNKCGNCIYFEYLVQRNSHGDKVLRYRGVCACPLKKRKRVYHQACDKKCILYNEGSNIVDGKNNGTNKQGTAYDRWA